METPCIHVCVIEAESGLCEGCGRSLDEIARWSQFTAQERAAIMRDLPDRRRRMCLGAEK